MTAESYIIHKAVLVVVVDVTLDEQSNKCG